jgi:hypothetical protein
VSAVTSCRTPRATPTRFRGVQRSACALQNSVAMLDESCISRRLALLLLVNQVGCDASDGGSDATGAGGGATSASSGGGGGQALLDNHEPQRWGSFVVGRGEIADQPADAFLTAHFDADPPPEGPSSWTCDQWTHGDCVAAVCTSTAEASGAPKRRFASAGRLQLGGSLLPLIADPGDDQRYNAGTTGELYAPGASLVFTASGDVVPAFSATVAAPPAFELSAAALADLDVLDRDRDLVVDWQPGPGTARVHLGVDTGRPDDDVTEQIQCDVPFSSGRLVVAAEALAVLEPGLELHLTVAARSSTEVIAGDWRVDVAISDFRIIHWPAVLP